MKASELLATLRATAAETARRARGLVETLSEEQLVWQPEALRWSIAQCFEHLVITGDAYYPRIAVAIDPRKRVAASEDQYAPSWMGRWIVQMTGPDSQRKLPAPKIFRPRAAAAAPPSAPFRFLEQQDDLLSLIDRARGADLRKNRIISPASRLLKFSVGEALQIVVGHQQRHLSQALRVRDDPRFPR